MRVVQRQEPALIDVFGPDLAIEGFHESLAVGCRLEESRFTRLLEAHE
jgi:hypothetical protein